jgi:acetate kinase
MQAGDGEAHVSSLAYARRRRATNQSVLDTIDLLAELAPLHNPECLAGIRSARNIFGADIPIVAVFDTAFHRSIPARAPTYAVDFDLAHKHGVHRYGFHGMRMRRWPASVPQQSTVH